MIYWLTGQPGAGKTTLAGWLKAHFHGKSIIVDGDDIREIFVNTDYSESGRRKNIEKAQILAKFLHHKGQIVVVSLVSPYRDQRESFKNEMGENIVEIFVHTEEDRGRNHFHVQNYEPPIENFIDCDTTNSSEYNTFLNLRKKLNI
jgi:adenylylsulfate kinase-like enzyme